LPWYSVPWTRQTPYLDDVWVGFQFTYPIRQLIHRAKYRRDIVCARFLGEVLAGRLMRSVIVPDKAVLFPVPITRRRLLVRGFNQAVELSFPIMRCLGLSIDVVSIYQPHPRRRQSKLDGVSRRANLRGAFKHRHKITVETAIIVDDVLTAGATVSAMARALKAAGAKSVVACVLAAV